MPRNVYGPDHEAFRSSVREFVERTLRPRSEQMLEVKSIDRDIWKEAGKQGLFGLDIPEEFGGAGAEDYRFNAIAAEEISAFNFAVSSCFGIHSDVCPPNSSGMSSPNRPCLPASFQMSRSIDFTSSICSARGLSVRSTNSRTELRKASWSGP